MARYRNRLQIVTDMLCVVRDNDGARKTRIMYLANLSWKLLNQYLNDLMEADLLSFDSSDCYVLTPKGRQFLDRVSKYSKRREEVDEHLNDLEDEKRILDKMCSNAKEVDEK